MAKFNLNLCLIGLFIASLSLLFLPENLLLNWQQGLILLVIFLSFATICRWLKWRKVCWLLVHFALFIACLSYVHFYALVILNNAKQINQLDKKIETEFVIEQILHQTDYQTMIVRADLSPSLKQQRIYLNWQLDAIPHIGERWQGVLHLRPIYSRLNQGGFDKQKWYFSQGISAIGKLKSGGRKSESFLWRDKRLQTAFQQTQSFSQQGLLLALGFGERAWLSQSQWLPYQRTNTAHLIAISGLHIGLAMLFGMGLARLIQIGLPTHWIGPTFPLLIGLACAGIYANLAGFSIPTRRAFMALAFLSVLKLSRHHYPPWQLFGVVVGFLLIADPLIVLSNSFWLSAGAVACLLTWYQFVPLSLFEWKGKPFNGIWRKIFALLHLQTGLFLLFTPILLFQFNAFALNSFIANLVIVPLFSFILIPTVLFAVLSQGAFYSWQISNQIAEYFAGLVEKFDYFYFPISEKLCYFYTALLACSWLGLLYFLYADNFVANGSGFSVEKIKKPTFFNLNSKLSLPTNWRYFLFGWLGLMSYCSIGYIRQIDRSDWRLEMLDVGQGLAILIRQGKQGILYDTGASWHSDKGTYSAKGGDSTKGGYGGSMAELEILPYLQRQGIELKQIILSHDDNDHSGGVPFLLKHYPNAKFISTSKKAYANRQADQFCLAGLNWQWQHLQFKILAPKEIISRSDNHHSCVLLIADQYHQILLTADADKASEYQFLPSLKTEIDFLQIGHHGSKTSTSSALLQQTKPHFGLISVARFNPWRFPHSDVITRLNQHQVKILTTAEMGQVSILFKQKDIEIQTTRNVFRPWYQQVIY